MTCTKYASEPILYADSPHMGVNFARRITRYALVVTIKAPGSNVDIYTPVESQIAIAVEA